MHMSRKYGFHFLMNIPSLIKGNNFVNVTPARIPAEFVSSEDGYILGQMVYHIRLVGFDVLNLNSISVAVACLSNA